ncbi:hypothetical protein QEN19_002793 [Hanseniaspora menglaensis]
MNFNNFFKVICFFFASIQVSTANKKVVTQDSLQVCSGMYSKSDWNGKIDPFISFNIKSLSNYKDGQNHDVSVVIFDFQDYTHIGKLKPGTDNYYLICDEEAIAHKMCNSSQKNQFLIETEVYDPITETTNLANAEILTFYQNHTGLYDLKYQVEKSGYYCALTYSNNGNLDYSAVVNFRNAFGQLPASEVNNLALYGLLAVFYAVGAVLYGFAFWKHKHELLPLQKYLLAFYGFLISENILIWSYYDLRNRKGNTSGVQGYMIFLSVVNSFKISFSFFILLVISLGFGIVYPKLQRKLMLKCKVFALVTFGFCAAFIIQNYLTPSDSQSSAILFTFFPAALCLMTFYIVSLKSLSLTMQYLNEQKQMVKLNMYNNLLKIVTASLVAVMAGTLMTSIMLLGMSAVEMVEKNWRYRFFFTDFWSSLVYFVVFTVISFIWRPTSTSYMLACSQQLPTDPENVADFDLDDMSSINNEHQYNSKNVNNSYNPNSVDNPFADTNEIDFNLSDDEQHHI